MIKKLYPGGKTKAFNITYDDGVEQDIPFVALLNRYGLKGTFNLNSQLMHERFAWTHENGTEVRRLGIEQVRGLYEGHEIASHTLTHPYMHDLSREEILFQMGQDKQNLESLLHRKVCGFAVPFDYYSGEIAECAWECGFEYARMSEFSHSYLPCRDYYFWKTGIYHIEEDLLAFVDGFLATEEALALCQIVGHSYDLDALNLWDTMEDICRAVSRQEDIWPCTNLELVRYLKAMDKAMISPDSIYNGSDRVLWFSFDAVPRPLQPGELCWI